MYTVYIADAVMYSTAHYTVYEYHALHQVPTPNVKPVYAVTCLPVPAAAAG